MTLLSALKPPAADSPAFVQAAFKRLEVEGLPTKKSEAWRFTPVRELVSEALSIGTSILEVDAPSQVTHLDSHVLFGALAHPEHFSAFNAATHSSPVLLKAEGNGETLTFTYRGAGASCPRVFLEVAANTELDLIERFEGESDLNNNVLEILLQPGARLRHLRVHQDSGRTIGTVAVRQLKDSHYESHVVTLGGRLTRLDLHVDLHGPGAECNLRGMYHVTGSDHVDHHLRVDHSAPQGTSRQEYRGLLDERSTAVFDSQAIVHRTGGGAEAHQSNRNLLLSEGANVFTKPHLEIDHDDVIASHGATVGAMEEDQVFYLRTRGIPEDTARAMLTFAFAQAILDELPSAEARAELSNELRERLPAGASLAAGGLEIE
jgi:FeS assembly protein SufD